MKNEISVRYLLADFEMEPAELTAIIGLAPSKTWRKGDLVAGTIGRYAENAWRIDSGLPKSATLSEHLDSLLELLETKREIISGLSERYHAEVSCIVYAREYVPVLTFEKEHLRRIVALGACVDIDLYCMMKDE